MDNIITMKEQSQLFEDRKVRTVWDEEHLTDSADAEQLFRIIQSIPSPKAEPFKQWLARVLYWG